MKSKSKYLLPLYLFGGTLISGLISWSNEDGQKEYADKQVSEFVNAPNLSLNNQVVSLQSIDENARIFYTIDGHLPTEGTARTYSSACDLTLEKDQQHLLRLRTSHRYKSPLTWELPFKAKVVRYTQQLKHLGYSKPQMKTVFSKRTKHHLKILSIAIAEEDLFDPLTGKMMMGLKAWNRERRGIAEPWWAMEANYREKGSKSSVYAGVEWIGEDGETIAQDNVKFRIHGNASRSFAQKSFRLEGESYYGSGALLNVCDLMPGDSLSSLMLRNSGNDWGKSMFQDAYIQSIAQALNLPSLTSQPVHVMINGVYWGIYNARPRFDERYLRQYSSGTGRLAIVELDSELDEGKQKDLDAYLELKKILSSKSLSEEDKMNELKRKIDIGNFTDYIILETFFSNGDWNPNNIKVFRFGKKDKWRWAIHDMDYGMTYAGYESGLNADLFVKLKKGKTVTSSVFNFLMKNQEYRAKFISRANELLTHELSSVYLNKKLYEYKEKYSADMDFQIARWQRPASMQHWSMVIEEFERFNVNRQKIYTNQLKSF